MFGGIINKTLRRNVEGDREVKLLCRDCHYLKCTNTGAISERYWCGLTGDGWNGKALGVYPWRSKPHPKCPLKEKEVEK